MTNKAFKKARSNVLTVTPIFNIWHDTHIGVELTYSDKPTAILTSKSLSNKQLDYFRFLPATTFKTPKDI